MKSLKWILLTIAGLCVSGALQAAQSGSSDDLIDTQAYNSKQQSSPLPAGSKIVAGKQNDFFILPSNSDNNSAGMKVAANESKAAVDTANDEVSTKPTLAANPSKQNESNIKLALAKTLHSKQHSKHLTLAAKGKPAGRHLAANNNHHQKHHAKSKSKSQPQHHLASKSKAHHHAAKTKLAAAHTSHSKVKKAQIRA